MEDLLEWCPHCHVPEVPKHCIVRFEEVILEPLPERQWSALVANGKEELTPYREVNIFCIIFSSSITRASNTKKRRTGCHHDVWSGMETETECKTSVHDWTPVGCRGRVLRRVLCPLLGAPCCCNEGRKTLVGSSTCSSGLSADRNEIIVRAWNH